MSETEEPICGKYKSPLRSYTRNRSPIFAATQSLWNMSTEMESPEYIRDISKAAVYDSTVSVRVVEELRRNRRPLSAAQLKRLIGESQQDYCEASSIWKADTLRVTKRVHLTPGVPMWLGGKPVREYNRIPKTWFMESEDTFRAPFEKSAKPKTAINTSPMRIQDRRPSSQQMKGNVKWLDTVPFYSGETKQTQAEAEGATRKEEECEIKESEDSSDVVFTQSAGDDDGTDKDKDQKREASYEESHSASSSRVSGADDGAFYKLDVLQQRMASLVADPHKQSGSVARDTEASPHDDGEEREQTASDNPECTVVGVGAHSSSSVCRGRSSAIQAMDAFINKSMSDRRSLRKSNQKPKGERNSHKRKDQSPSLLPSISDSITISDSISSRLYQSGMTIVNGKVAQGTKGSAPSVVKRAQYWPKAQRSYEFQHYYNDPFVSLGEGKDNWPTLSQVINEQYPVPTLSGRDEYVEKPSTAYKQETDSIDDGDNREQSVAESLLCRYTSYGSSNKNTATNSRPTIASAYLTTWEGTKRRTSPTKFFAPRLPKNSYEQTLISMKHFKGIRTYTSNLSESPANTRGPAKPSGSAPQIHSSNAAKSSTKQKQNPKSKSPPTAKLKSKKKRRRRKKSPNKKKQRSPSPTLSDTIEALNHT